ncbi:hypothetical protein [uncultured Maritimibacter sp.]|uniref:hypothetical protein n=1 Tax=uncultured Maritimibacter sp. TaxID=991866 RepID=UPI00260C4F5B|nr:hypothetical protein [uncultured Maritimibacter sp.]
MTRFSLALPAALALIAAPALADDVTDTLASALEAYEAGDIAYAMEELDYAKTLLAALKTEALSKYLPEAPPGWTLTVNEDANAGMAMFGGGTGTEGAYSNGTDSVTITLMADNPMVTAFGGMLANAAVMGNKVERVGRQKFMIQDGEMTALVDNRILVQADGAAPEVMIPLLEAIDYKALEDFGG